MRLLLAAAAAISVGCASSSSSSSPEAGSDAGSGALDAATSADAPRTTDAGAAEASGADAPGGDANDANDANEVAPPPCTTRITYGSAWIHPSGHPASFDDVAGPVTWDGTCTDDGASSFALLSNGFKPYFQGNGACIVALDESASCPGAGAPCTTRIAYGSAWIAPAGHASRYDDVTGRVFSDGVCHASGAQSYANLSNGWTPTYSGTATCELSFEYTQCGGLYANPVIPGDCPDPGVLHDGDRYVLTCTSGDAADAFPIYTSPDLASWTPAGHVFPSGHRPAWAVSDFWAPEIHVVGGQYVVYFSARGSDGMLAVGAASSPAATGPFTPLAAPLVHDAAMGHIDASEITAGGTPYLLWKDDGNAIGQPTPIHAQPLAADGLSLVGSPSTLITNDQPWEGAVTEAPFMVQRGGTFFLFYSGNSYATPAYAVGVAQGPSPTGPFTKAPGPVLASGGPWAGPGHCAVVETAAGDTAIVYAAWAQGCVNGPGCGREVLTDLVSWGSGGPAVPLAPSSTSRPLP